MKFGIWCVLYAIYLRLLLFPTRESEPLDGMIIILSGICSFAGVLYAVSADNKGEDNE